MNWIPVWTPATILFYGILYVLIHQNKQNNAPKITPSTRQENMDQSNWQLATEKAAHIRDLGSQITTGDHEEAMSTLARLSKQGDAFALASFTWSALRLQKFQEAIDLYDSSKLKIVPDSFSNTPSELANCESNYALNKLALGGSYDEALAVWKKNRARGHHLESLFYPILIAHRQGNLELRNSLLTRLKPGQTRMLKGIFAREISISEGWFNEWCADSLEVLRQAT